MINNIQNHLLVSYNFLEQNFSSLPGSPYSLCAAAKGTWHSALEVKITLRPARFSFIAFVQRPREPGILLKAKITPHNEQVQNLPSCSLYKTLHYYAHNLQHGQQVSTFVWDLDGCRLFFATKIFDDKQALHQSFLQILYALSFFQLLSR